MEYYVYDGLLLEDVISLDPESKKLFEAENPHFRLEECDDSPIIFEEDDDEDYID